MGLLLIEFKSDNPNLTIPIEKIKPLEKMNTYEAN